MKKILVLLTNQATMGDTDEKNGTYAPELTHALHEFIQAGYDYDLASIKGGAAPLYGEDADDDVNRAVLNDQDFQTRVSDTIPCSDITLSQYDAVFYPGGFGLLWDLAEDRQAADITARLYEAGAVVGAVCHGPAALLPITLSDGQPLLTDKVVTSFTREEEIDFGTVEKVPFLVEERLTRAAAGFSKVAPWGNHVIEQDRLITGQNPTSAQGVGKAMIKRLKQNN